jgi:glycosyltransferase involved in cell wall biosynthesis
MRNMKLSIITINYNNLEGLKKTVASVIHQTWKEFQYIIIDGGSIDGSAVYIESQRDKIDYWVSEPDNGIYNAMNKGIKVATGDYLLFLNSGDDLTDLKALGENHSHLKEKDIIYFNINVVGDNTFFIKRCPEILTFSFLYRDTLPHQSTFIKKTLFEDIGYYDEKLKIASDWKFFILALMSQSATYKHIDAVISNYYLDGISSTEDFSNERKEVLSSFFSCYTSDYDELFKNREELVVLRNYQNTNRYRMLVEIEESKIGKKMVSILFRVYLLLFSKKKLKDILNTKLFL